MLFNSLDFIIFFPTVFFLFYLLPHRLRWILLLIASWYFYASFRMEYFFLILTTTVSGYATALLIEKVTSNRQKKLWLILNLAIVLGMLIYFKYFNLLVETINDAAEKLSAGMGFPVLDIILPVGISFYTFQVIGYTLDVYWGKTKPERHPGIFALYVSFFPQLVAGPIERADRLIPQFYRKQVFDYQRVKRGFILILWGFFQKIAIADKIAILVDPVFAGPDQYNGYQLLLAMVLFSFQIYCDFAGYTNIALGTAKTLGIDLMDNFNKPFISKNISEFWRRWHISLSTWARDYLFMPISYGRRKWGHFATIYAVFITFIFLGIWHGAAWVYLFFGFCMGVAFYYELITVNFRLRLSKLMPLWLYDGISMLLTFTFITVLFLFFRIQSIGDTFHYFGKIFSNFNLPWLAFDIDNLELAILLFAIFLMELFQYLRRNKTLEDWLSGKHILFRWFIYLLICFTIINFGVFSQKQFIYFQF